jgi:hypothetical protein
MVATRRLAGGAAVLTCLAIFGGVRPTPAGQNPAPAATARAAVGQPGADEKAATEAVSAIAAANAMIEHGLTNRKPLAIIAGVEVLWETPSNPDGEKLTVEGASSEKATPAMEKEYLLGLLRTAEGQLPGNEDVQKAAALVRKKLGDSGSRGTAKGATKWEGIVDPLNKKTDKPVTVIKRTFLSNQVGKITVTKEFNGNVQLDLKLYDGDGNPVASRPGHPLQFEFRVPKGKDQLYRLEIRNHHSKGVLLRVDTN